MVIPLSSPTFLDRLRKGLSRTRQVLDMPVGELLKGQRPLEPEDLEAVEEALLAADLGVPAVAEAMAVLKEKSGAALRIARRATLAVKS